uniref:Uncharacterized protein n=1 Tax=viral metagenome TaxID=1070528 RepID=A0A6C0HN15_9ZZZZ
MPKKHKANNGHNAQQVSQVPQVPQIPQAPTQQVSQVPQAPTQQVSRAPAPSVTLQSEQLTAKELMPKEPTLNDLSMVAVTAQAAMKRSAIRLSEIQHEFEENRKAASHAQLQFAAAAAKASSDATALALALALEAFTP